MTRSVEESGTAVAHGTRVLNILRRVKGHLEERYGDAVRRVLLFGSFARGDATEDSDVDVAIVVSDDLEPCEVEAFLDELLFEVLLEEGELVSVVALREDHFEDPRSPFVMNIRSEGIAV